MTAIFISHSSADHAAAAAMKSWLEQQGHTSLFLDFDPGVGIVAGSDWEETVYFKLRQCHAVIALLTINWLASKWCFAEVVQARERGKPVFPVKVAPCESAAVLSDVQHIDLTAKPEDGYARLMVGLRQHGLDPLDVFDWKPDRSPYPGLLSFQEEDAAVYFGRRADILNGLETLNALRRQGRGAPRLVLFLGASGSGKSSLVRAGLIPRLKKAPSEWLPLSPFRPQDDPLRELAITLADGFGTHGRPRYYGEIAQVLASAAERTPADGGALLSLIRDIAIAAGRRDATVVLAIDQAEELFGYGAAGPADRFLRLLRAALEAPDRQLIAVATLRSDFLGEFQLVRALQDAEYDHHLAYRVVPVDAIAERSFAEIIQGPARVAGLRLEDGLVDVMVSDTGTRDALPLLAFTLRRLWERRDQDGVLRLRHYDEIGRLEGAIRLEADRVLADAGPSGEELEALRAAFVPAMVRINTDGGYARRQAKVDDLPRPALRLLQRFVDARLLVSDRSADGFETLEVAHEALLRTWPQLANWLAEDQDRLRLLESVRRAAEEWFGSGSEDDLLVHRDGRLHEALALTANPRFALQPASVEKRYLDACLAAQLASEAAKREEQERRIRDAEQIAEEQKKAAAAQRKTARRTLAGLAGALVLAGISAIVSWQAIRNSWEADRQRTIALENAGQLALSNTQLEVEKTRAEEAAARAEREARVANGRRLAAQAKTALLADQVDRALLFGLEAYDTSDEYDTRDSLLTALEHSPHLAAFLQGHSQNPNVGGTGAYSVAFAPDGRSLVSGGRDGQVILWDVAGQRVARRPLGTHSNDVERVNIDPTGRVLASAGFDGLFLWDLKTGALLFQLEGILGPGFSGGVAAVAFSPDGRTLVSGGSDNNVKLWDVASGKPIGEPLTGHNGWVTDVSVSRDGRLIASASCASTEENTCTQGEIRLWRLDTREPVGAPIVVSGGTVTSLAFSPDGATLASGGGDNAVRLWSVEGGAQIGQPLTGHTGRVTSIAFHPDGGTIASASADKMVRLWNASTRAPIGGPLVGHAAEVFSVAFNPDGSMLASAGDDNLVILWTVPGRGAISTPLAGVGSSGATGAFSPDGRLLAAGGGDANVRMWNVETGAAVGHWQVADPSSKVTEGGTSYSWSHALVESVAFSPDGNTLASGTLDGTIAFWSVPEGTPVGGPIQFPGEVRKLAFSADGRHLVTAGSGKVVLWDAASGTQVGDAWEAHTGDVYGLDISPDDRVVASGSLDGTAILWDAESGQPIGAPLAGQEGWVNDVAFAPDGNIIATASDEIILWDVRSHAEIGRIPNDSRNIAFSPDGSMLAASRSDHSIALWDVASRTLVAHTLIDPYTSGQIEDLAFSPTDRLLAVVHFDGPIVLWNVEIGAWRSMACRKANRNLTVSEWEEVGLSDPYRKTCPDLPTHPSVYEPALQQSYSTGVEASQAGDQDEALAALTAVIDGVAPFRQESGFVAPRVLVEAYIQRGVIHFVRYDFDLAVFDWEAARDLSPTDSRAHSNLGFAYFEKARLDDAIGSWRTAVQIDPGNDEGWGGLGIALFARGDRDEAVAAYGRALELTSGFATPEWLKEERSWSDKAVGHVRELANLVAKASAR